MSAATSITVRLGQAAPGWFLEARTEAAGGLVIGPNLAGTASIVAFERLAVAPTWRGNAPFR